MDEFWELTPSELNLYIEATSEMKHNEFKKLVECAYYQAYFHNAKVNLSEFLRKLDNKKPDMTDEQLYLAFLGIPHEKGE